MVGWLSCLLGFTGHLLSANLQLVLWSGGLALDFEPLVKRKNTPERPNHRFGSKPPRGRSPRMGQN